MFKRIGLFLVTNLAILVVVSLIVNLLGLNHYLTQNGLNLPALLGFCAVFGFVGSFISLAISKWSAKMMVGAQVIKSPRSAQETWLFETIQRHAQQANIGMPEIAIFNASEPNAFATGMSKNNALVAVSTGLLQQMQPNEIDAVLGHEISHIANGDMVTMALIQGVVNTFVMFLARVVGYFVDTVLLRNNNEQRSGVGIGYYITTMVCEIIFGILASVVVMWFSRQREFRADAGGAHLAGKENMIAALRRLQQVTQAHNLPGQLNAFGISGARSGGLGAWFMSHPPLEERIQALMQGSSIQ